MRVKSGKAADNDADGISDNSIVVRDVNHHNSSINQFFVDCSSYHSQQQFIIPTLKAGA
ncbi:MAG TPA: hypothetical protein VJ729_00625 [Nitrososphaeraceae archaeon]|nr:hypothetical protein [Nitrososphaeraceae archaeon]